MPPLTPRNSAKERNARIAGVYFKSARDLDLARAAAAKLGLSLTAYLREAVTQRTSEILTP